MSYKFEIEISSEHKQFKNNYSGYFFYQYYKNNKKIDDGYIEFDLSSYEFLWDNKSNWDFIKNNAIRFETEKYLKNNYNKLKNILINDNSSYTIIINSTTNNLKNGYEIKRS